jgi:hypothetical protein
MDAHAGRLGKVFGQPLLQGKLLRAWLQCWWMALFLLKHVQMAKHFMQIMNA